MARVQLKDLPAEHTVTRQEMKKILAGYDVMAVGGNLSYNLSSAITTTGDDMQMWQFSVQQSVQNLTQYLTMMSNISSAWDKTMDSIVKNIK